MRLVKYAGYYWVEPDHESDRAHLDALAGERVFVEHERDTIERLCRPTRTFADFAQGYQQGMNFVRRNRGDSEL